MLSELLQNQSLRFLDPIGSLLDECAVDEASAAAASPAFMSGAVLLPFMDILMCQVCVQLWRLAPRHKAAVLQQQSALLASSHNAWPLQRKAVFQEFQHHRREGTWQPSGPDAQGRQPPGPLQDCPETAAHGDVCVQAINNRGTPHILANMLSTWHRQAHRPAPQDAHMHANTLAPDRQPARQLVGTAGSGSAGQGVTAGHPAQHGSCALLRPDQLCGFGAAVLQQVPAQHTGCSTFGELFDWLLQHRGMLCCGLYRQATHYRMPLWYVYTNPHKDVELRCTDRAFVLGPAQSVCH